MGIPRPTLTNFLRATTKPVTLVQPFGELPLRPSITPITAIQREGSKLTLLKETGRDSNRPAGDLRPVGDQTWRFGCKVISLTVRVLGSDAPDSGTLDVLCTGINPNNQYGLILSRIHSGTYRTPLPDYADIFRALSEVLLAQRAQIPLPAPAYLKILRPHDFRPRQMRLVDYMLPAR